MRYKYFYKRLFWLVLLIPVLAAWQLKNKQQTTPAKQVAKRPNILFCIADDASLQHMSAYGMTNYVKTPNFDRIAREGLLFANAYTPNPKCAPSRAMILTGRNLWQLEEAGNHSPFWPAKFTSFVEALGKNGYQVGFTGKGWSPGDPGQVNGKPRQLTGPAYNEIKIAAPTKAISPVNYTANLAAFLDKKPKDQPFCFWYGGHEPHRAYAYGTGITLGKKKLSDVNNLPAFWPDNETVRNDVLDYAYEVEYYDQHIGQMLELLEKRGELENTIVVVTSDNGMPFPRVKGHIYEFANHLPLAIMWKNGIKNPGRKIQDYVSFVDFAPTFLELAGLKTNAANMQPMQGKSLQPIFASNKAGQVDTSRDHVLLGRERNDVGRPHDEGYPVRGIVKGDYYYVRNYEPERWPTGNPETGYLDTDGGPTKTEILKAKRNGGDTRTWDLAFGKRPAEELYRITKDPYCLTNLAADKNYSQIKESLHTQMEQELKSQQDPRMAGKGSVFDKYLYSEPKVRNFYERYTKGEAVKAGWVQESDFEKKPN
ncbi:sulfatase family protein [Adhaeribacter aerolatus]|nr:sulfatase [Adhaeribacter aerolatus]